MSTQFCLVSVTAILFLLAQSAGTPAPAHAQNTNASPQQITILYDAFGKDPAMQKDWGYAALIEYDGKRILFDTGNNPRHPRPEREIPERRSFKARLRRDVAPPWRPHGRTGLRAQSKSECKNLRS